MQDILPQILTILTVMARTDTSQFQPRLLSLQGNTRWMFRIANKIFNAAWSN